MMTVAMTIAAAPIRQWNGGRALVKHTTVMVGLGPTIHEFR